MRKQIAFWGLWCAGLAVAVMVLCGGCVRSSFHEVTTSASTGDTDETSWSGVTVVPPFGKVDPTVHRMEYAFGGSNKIDVGQSAEGIDATNQKVILDFLGAIVSEAIKAYMTAKPVPAGEGVTMEGVEVNGIGSR